MMKRFFSCVVSLALASVFAAGCATHVAMTSDPGSATIYAKGCGRPSYQWRDVGRTPMTYKSWYSHEIAFVKWPDGVQSAVQDLPGGCGAEGQAHFVRPAALPASGTNKPPAR